MLRKVKELKGYKLDALDGEIGKVKEFYFDDRHWMVRYLVADTGGWLTGRQVLISPYALNPVAGGTSTIPTNLTKKQIEASPSLHTDEPVSRQFEGACYDYYAWPGYWYGPYTWGVSPYLVRDREISKETATGEKVWDPHLRSTKDVTGHYVRAFNGDVGHVEDFIIDDETWTICYLSVNTRNWWPGKKVLVSPQWIERVSWQELKVFVKLPRETIKQSPEYMGEALTREFEGDLSPHYNQRRYWSEQHHAFR